MAIWTNHWDDDKLVQKIYIIIWIIYMYMYSCTCISETCNVSGMWSRISKPHIDLCMYMYPALYWKGTPCLGQKLLSGFPWILAELVQGSHNYYVTVAFTTITHNVYHKPGLVAFFFSARINNKIETLLLALFLYNTYRDHNKCGWLY